MDWLKTIWTGFLQKVPTYVKATLWFLGLLALLVVIGYKSTEASNGKIYYTNLPFRVLNSPVPPGERVHIIRTICNETGKIATLTVERSLRQQGVPQPNIYPIDSQSISVHPGCNDSESFAPTIPINVVPGQYIIDGKATVFTDSGIIQLPWQTQDFTVEF